MGLPKVIFVRKDDDDLLAYDSVVDAIEDDGPTVIGRYELVTEKKARKVVEEMAK
jgi:hypothetical protein